MISPRPKRMPSRRPPKKQVGRPGRISHRLKRRPTKKQEGRPGMISHRPKRRPGKKQEDMPGKRGMYKSRMHKLRILGEGGK